ncbi:MAG: cytochrome c [Chromatiales bacterium]|jgi:mono/diheme cytochrome c family protein
MTKTIQLFTLAALTSLISGCGGPSDFTPSEGMTAVEIYNSACADCHGDNGAGKFGFLFKIAGSDDSVEEMAATIKEGGTIMPSFPNLSDEQRLMMAGYIKTF